MRVLVLAIAIAVLTSSAKAQNVDPQAVMNQLLRNALREYKTGQRERELQRENKILRLEQEQRKLEWQRDHPNFTQAPSLAEDQAHSLDGNVSVVNCYLPRGQGRSCGYGLGADTTPGGASPLRLHKAEVRVPLKSEGGIFIVPVEINGAIKLNFAIDSGASDVSIPLDVFTTLWRTGTVKDSDLLGNGRYVLANGSNMQSLRFRIRSLKMAGVVLNDVPASVSTNQGFLLLGQSFLRRFKSWSINNEKHELDLEIR